MDRPRATSATQADRTGVQLFLQNPSPKPEPTPEVVPDQGRLGVLSPALWIVDGLMVLTAVSVLFLPGLDRTTAIVLGCWLITLAAGVGVLAVLSRR
jgi:hypothetical protein